MLLAPCTQQWDRHVTTLAERFRAATAFDWGLTHLEIDREALKNGRISLLGAAGVLPDGTPFRAPEDDPLPSPRAIEGHFGTKQEAVVVSIGFPAARPGQSQLGDPATPGAPGTMGRAAAAGYVDGERSNRGWEWRTVAARS
jgi:type VI secretion system protein ImpJ